MSKYNWILAGFVIIALYAFFYPLYGTSAVGGVLTMYTFIRENPITLILIFLSTYCIQRLYEKYFKKED